MSSDEQELEDNEEISNKDQDDSEEKEYTFKEDTSEKDTSGITPLLEGEDSESEPEDLTELLEQLILQLQKKKKTYLSSNLFVMLFQLRDAVKQLARSLCYHPNFQQRKDRQTLSKKLLSNTEWIELEELTLLL
ncbi:11374_t:CDS:2, partial [Dentiscutata heterogama]